MGSNKKLTQSEVEKIFKDVGYELLDKYVNATLTYKCEDKDKYLYKTRYSDFKRGIRPEKVSKRNPYTIYNINNYLKIENINQILISTEYESSSSPLIWHCPIHEEEYPNLGINLMRDISAINVGMKEWLVKVERN